ncbi:MAG: enoyl-CoA hydratase/isomerase family protein [Acidobacteria bacterium]|nr:enoyl-CoA hydratase/isomerase family protein [Acidobacteriota bacterium]
MHADESLVMNVTGNQESLIRVHPREAAVRKEIMPVYTKIGVEVTPPHARITLAHPPQNVIDLAMMDELAGAVAEIESRSDVVTLTIAGSEKVFSAGVDVAAHTPDNVRDMLTKFHGVIRALVGSRKVTIACVRGNCLGGGAELALVCDLVYTSDDAAWQFPEIKLGCFPPVAAVALAALIGQKRATELILTARKVAGPEAAALGLANGVAAGDDVENLVHDACERLEELSPAALRVTKKALYAWDAMHFDKGLARAEQIYFDELMKTADAVEGINAFLEKRKPVWKGK